MCVHLYLHSCLEIHFIKLIMSEYFKDFPASKAGDPGSIPGLGRSPGEGKGYPLHYSGRENSVDCIVYRVAKSQT